LTMAYIILVINTIYSCPSRKWIKVAVFVATLSCCAIGPV